MTPCDETDILPNILRKFAQDGSRYAQIFKLQIRDNGKSFAPSEEYHGFARITDAPLSSATEMEMKSAVPRHLPYFYSPPD